MFSLLASFAVVPALWAKAGAPFVGVYTATVVMAFLATLFLGLFAQQPLVASPALGVHLWLVWGVVYSLGVPWQAALAASFSAGILYGLTLWSPFRRVLSAAMPDAIVQAMRGGMGLLIVFMGLQTGKLVVGSPLTVTMLGTLSEPAAFVALMGLATSLALWAMGIRAAAFWGALVAVVTALSEGFLILPDAPFLLPEGLDRTALVLDFSYMWELSGVVLALWLILFFDTFGAFAALRTGNAVDVAEKRTFFTLAAGNVLAPLLGAGPLALAKEGAAARAVDARTSFAAYAAAAVLLVVLFLEPVAAAVLDFPAVLSSLLIFSGCCLLKGLRLVWQEVSEHAAFFAVLLVTPLSSNLAAGLGVGTILYVFLEIFSGRGKRLHPILYVLACYFALYFVYVS